MEKYKLECHHCRHLETNHQLLFEFNRESYQSQDYNYENEEFIEGEQKDAYQVFQCLGCENVVFINTSKMFYLDGNIYKTNIYKYPSYDFLKDIDEHAEFFLHELELRELPVLISNIYDEVETAFRNTIYNLAGIGLRTIIEAVCIQQKIKGRNLQQKIENLYQTGLVSNNDLSVLQNLREIGNISAHRIKSPSESTLENALHVVNHTLRSIYIIPKKAKKIRVKK